MARLQDLPAIDRLLQRPAAVALREQHGHTLVVRCARDLLARLRAQVQAAALTFAELDDAALQAALARQVDEALAPRLKTVFNLTGTVIHTNLGRAVLAESAVERVAAAMAGPNNLEYDLGAGGRGDRDRIVEELLCELTGAEAATVVNNNAAAVLLTLAAMASRREVIVSRGELVEIGGAFRMPDVMAAAGCRLVEVGTTNRTHLQDYISAITPRTALLLKVHTSNYAVQGFTASVGEGALASGARAHGVALVSDLGAGALVDLAAYGLPQEPMPRTMIEAGCDVVTFSGDKLLGGPQAGLIVGSRAAVARIRKHPLKRALRMSKLPLAALEATLLLYRRPERLALALPTLRLLTRPLAQIQALAQRLQPLLAQALGARWQVEVHDMRSQIGSGSLPVDRLPSAGLAAAPVAARGAGRALQRLESALRALPTPVIGRIEHGQLRLDLRCLEAEDAFVAQLPALQVARP